MPTRRYLAPVSLAVAVLLGACGGGGGGDGVASLAKATGDDASTSTTLSKADAEKAMLDWTACMRKNGVDIPDPTTDKDGNLSLGVRVARPSSDSGDSTTANSADATPPNRDAFEKARKACGEPPLQGGGPLSKKDREAFQEQALKFAKCMRDEGVKDFPDPDFSADGPGAGPVLRSETNADSGERKGPFGDIDMDDPTVQKAFETCQKADGGKGGPVIRFGGPAGAGNATSSATASASSDS